MKSAHARMIAAVSTIVLVAIGLLWLRSSGDRARSQSSDDAIGGHQPAAANASTVGGPSNASSALSQAPIAAPDDKRDLLEQARGAHDQAMTAKRDRIDFDQPRPDTGAPFDAVQSREERAMSPAQKAHQTQRMVAALSDRAARVQQRIERARERGDQDEIARQERILERLQSRVTTLDARAEALASQAQAETAADAPGDAPGEPDEPGE